MEKKPPTKGPAVVDANLSKFSEHDEAFWKCHGINCILSDYKTGNWTPLFEEIYVDGGRVPSLEDIAQRVADKFNVGQRGANDWPGNAKIAMAWAVHERNIIHVYYQEAIRRLKASFGQEADVETLAKQPHQPMVWLLFDYMQNKIQNRKNG